MIKKFFIVFFVCSVLGCVSPGTGKFYMKTVKAKNANITNNVKIAVLPENWYWTGVSNFLPRALITEFLDLGFEVVERTQLERLFEEMKLDYSGAVKDRKEARMEGGNFETLDKTSLKKMGELLGVNALLITYIVPTFSSSMKSSDKGAEWSSGESISQATFRLVDIETAKVLFSITVINPGVFSTSMIVEAISSNIKQLLEGESKIMSEAGQMDKKQIIVKPQMIKIEDSDETYEKGVKKSEKQGKLKLMQEYYSEAVEYYKDGQYEEAIAKLNENLKLDSNHSESKNLMEKVKLRKTELKKK